MIIFLEKCSGVYQILDSVDDLSPSQITDVEKKSAELYELGAELRPCTKVVWTMVCNDER